MTINLSLHELMLIQTVLTEMKDMTVKQMTPEAIGRLNARAFIAAMPLTRALNNQIAIEVTNV